MTYWTMLVLFWLACVALIIAWMRAATKRDYDGRMRLPDKQDDVVRLIRRPK